MLLNIDCINYICKKIDKSSSLVKFALTNKKILTEIYKSYDLIDLVLHDYIFNKEFNNLQINFIFNKYYLFQTSSYLFGTQQILYKNSTDGYSFVLTIIVDFIENNIGNLWEIDYSNLLIYNIKYK